MGAGCPVNGRHVLKCTITAEVVPLQVGISCAELHMAFAPDSLESTVEAGFRMINSGNATAEFFWAPRGPFSVTPESGLIAAFSEIEATVVWAPTPGSCEQHVTTN